MVIEQATEGELANFGVAWKSGTVGKKIKVRQAQLKGGPKSIVDSVDYEVKLSKNITIPPGKAVKTMGMVKLPVLSKRLNVTVEPMDNLGHINGVHLVESYSMVKMGTKRVPIGIVNNLSEKVTLRKGAIVGQLKAANIVPPILAPKMSMDEDVLEYVSQDDPKNNILENEILSTKNSERRLPPKAALTPERLDQLFSKIDFSSMEEWPDDQQQEVVDLFKEYHHIFALPDLELGCTSKINHKIHLDDPVPFKHRYR